MSFSLKNISRDNVETAWNLFNELCDEQGSRRYLKASFDDFCKAFLNGVPPSFQGLVGYEGGTPVSLVTWDYLFSLYSPRRMFNMRTLYVRPDFRKRGLGRKLVAFMGQKAMDDDCCAMKWSVMPGNDKALKFYKSMGIEPDPDGLVEFWVDQGDFEKLVG
ncbi:MAG: GNAT family N-acetyltransferase [Rhodospirillales bacterium]|nr:GNAT family N-acetyltransferase [Rhodospirillales bacterium]